MALKSTVIRFSAICPLSPWERVRERAKRKSSRKRRLKKMATRNAHYPKEKHKKQLLPNTFQTACSRQN